MILCLLTPTYLFRLKKKNLRKYFVQAPYVIVECQTTVGKRLVHDQTGLSDQYQNLNTNSMAIQCQVVASLKQKKRTTLPTLLITFNISQFNSSLYPHPHVSVYSLILQLGYETIVLKILRSEIG